MARALWKGTVLAESDFYEMVEGNTCFPPGSVRMDHLRPGSRHYTCPWEGKADYYDVVAGGDLSRNAAWTCPRPKEAARQIQAYTAFEDGVSVER